MIELYIDNKLVELSDSIDYSLTKSFFDLSDPSKTLRSVADSQQSDNRT